MAKKCIICNSNKHIKIFKKDSFLKNPTYICNKCGLYFLFSNDKEINKKCHEYYTKDYWSVFRKRENSRYLLNSIIKILRYLNTEPLLQTWHYNLIKQFISGKKSKKFLDIGCGKGDTLMFFSKKGYDIKGIESDINNTRKINSLFGKKVCINGLIEGVKLKERFDIIYLCHVFEHLTRPDIFLEKIKGNLKSGGVIFLEVPNCENKKMLDVSINDHPHIFHFTLNSIKRLFQANNYKILKLGTYSEIRKGHLSMFLLMIFKLNNYKNISRFKGDKLIIIAKK